MLNKRNSDAPQMSPALQDKTKTENKFFIWTAIFHFFQMHSEHLLNEGWAQSKNLSDATQICPARQNKNVKYKKK